ncbi:MAG: alpha/beta hydrolase [Candidatus Firestonebacteria bacterium]|nr:alpha/beta hydrolase [Candidatus Firestonebacteria bacterium]
MEKKSSRLPKVSVRRHPQKHVPQSSRTQTVAVPTARGPLALEVLSRLPASPRALPPLLFVHGIIHGAWCWDEYFLDYFARRGFRAYALSLRGHGQSQGQERIHHWDLNDYVADVRAVRAWLQQQVPNFEPVLIGHSLGGVVVQRYMDRYPQDAAGAVFLASAPRMSFFQYLINIRRLLPAFAAAVVTRNFKDMLPLAEDYLFSSEMPLNRREKYREKFSVESQLAILQLIFNSLSRRMPPIRKPTLVIGAEQDSFFTVASVSRQALYHGSPAHFFPMAHDLMLEPSWEQPARCLADWLLGQPFAKPAGR